MDPVGNQGWAGAFLTRFGSWFFGSPGGWFLTLSNPGHYNYNPSYAQIKVLFETYYDISLPASTFPSNVLPWPGWWSILNNLPVCDITLSNNPCKVPDKTVPNLPDTQVHVFKWYVFWNKSIRPSNQDAFMWFQCGIAASAQHVFCNMFDGNYANIGNANNYIDASILSGGAITHFQAEAPGSCSADNCVVCPVNTFKSYTGMSKECTSCQSGAVAHIASIDQSQCNCTMGYFRQSNVSCPSCANAYYSFTQDVLECTACPAFTYTDPALHPWNTITDCRVCKLCNMSTNAAFMDHLTLSNFPCLWTIIM
jgi:hypothetical protein